MNKLLKNKAIWALVAAFVIMSTLGAQCNPNEPFGGGDNDNTSGETEPETESDATDFASCTADNLALATEVTTLQARIDELEGELASCTVAEADSDATADCIDRKVSVNGTTVVMTMKDGETETMTVNNVSAEVSCEDGNLSANAVSGGEPESDDDESEDEGATDGGDVTCESLGEDIPFDVRLNMDTGDPNDDVWTITNANNKGKGNVQFVIPPTYNVDMEGENPRGEYAFIADGLDAALCLADKMWDGEAIRVLVGSQEQDGWLTSRDLDEIDGWDHLEVTRFNQIAIEVEGVVWNPVPFDGKSEFGGDDNWHLVQHWDGVDSSDVYGGVIAPNWVLTIPSNWQGTDFIVELLTDSVDLARLWSRFHQMEAVDVYNRDEKPEITMFFCGPDGEEREDFEATLPAGWTCKAQD